MHRYGDTDCIPYYITLAMTICRRLNACNSDVYTRCLFDLYFIPSTTLEEKKRLLKEYCNNFKQPYYDGQQVYSIVNNPSDRSSQPTNSAFLSPFSSESSPSKLTYCLIMKSNYNKYSRIITIAKLFVKMLVYINILEQQGIFEKYATGLNAEIFHQCYSQTALHAVSHRREDIFSSTSSILPQHAQYVHNQQQTHFNPHSRQLQHSSQKTKIASHLNHPQIYAYAHGKSEGQQRAEQHERNQIRDLILKLRTLEHEILEAGNINFLFPFLQPHNLPLRMPTGVMADQSW